MMGNRGGRINTNIWDKLSKKYDSLWVQKYSLTPSRNKVLKLLNTANEEFSLLDVGCATGQLLCEIREKYPKAQLFGIDKSQDMLNIARRKNSHIEFICTAAENFNADMKFDFITCCHSFPYYSNKPKVLQNLSTALKNDGKAIFIQAGINNGYDKFVMWVIEKTAEKADYYSKNDFCRLATDYFAVEECFAIKERWFMPSICGFILGKKL